MQMFSTFKKDGFNCFNVNTMFVTYNWRSQLTRNITKLRKISTKALSEIALC